MLSEAGRQRGIYFRPVNISLSRRAKPRGNTRDGPHGAAPRRSTAHATRGAARRRGARLRRLPVGCGAGAAGRAAGPAGVAAMLRWLIGGGREPQGSAEVGEPAPGQPGAWGWCWREAPGRGLSRWAGLGPGMGRAPGRVAACEAVGLIERVTERNGAAGEAQRRASLCLGLQFEEDIEVLERVR